jgi:hypothetical protein
MIRVLYLFGDDRSAPVTVLPDDPQNQLAEPT